MHQLRPGPPSWTQFTPTLMSLIPSDGSVGPTNQDNLTHSAFVDYNGADPPGPTANKSVALGSDRAEGWDMQLILSPLDNLQMVFTWAHIDKKVLSAGQWATYPYPQDRWAPWYFPATWAGLQGQTLEDAYTDPTDTSTRVVVGTGLGLDDTPKNQGSMWLHYAFEDESRLKGLRLGFGANYEGPRQYFSGITHGGGAVIAGDGGDPLTLETEDRYQYDAFVRYEFLFKGRDTSIQLQREQRARYPETVWADLPGTTHLETRAEAPVLKAWVFSQSTWGEVK